MWERFMTWLGFRRPAIESPELEEAERKFSEVVAQNEKVADQAKRAHVRAFTRAELAHQALLDMARQIDRQQGASDERKV